MLENEDNVQQTTEPLTENNAQQEIENKVNEAENKLNKLNQEIKEKEIINIFKKYQVKTEFYDFLKFKTNNLENSKIEETIKKIIKEQPVFKETINTGGKPQTIITNQPNSIKNALLDYKNKNKL
ncbi:hypothetical protein [Spiroplasma endosymbiont of Danaus chrysippus]|uniref:hypothetical protein n=1 Tax=Spiroplasma endosymbiont of Danaus chrysippus TaxID=2691041 RepID=UPI0013CD766C|nr:hypothetical protein [Spiroplasma endosymbiont of Danaus chrysippus]CAB1053650.1 hypothetical protein [Spiroplasma endosymbiont of Danaus chrysippus]CAB1053788.1 hypothetical protein [Spiroplasma endosymbiont of Danaus chrysippus]